MAVDKAFRFIPSYTDEAKEYKQEFEKRNISIDPFWFSVIDYDNSDEGYYWMAFVEETKLNRTNTCSSIIHNGKWVTAIEMKHDIVVIKNNWFVKLLFKFNLLKTR